MITDFIWKAFEKTGDTRYYLEYIRYRETCFRQQSSECGERMDKTG